MASSSTTSSADIRGNAFNDVQGHQINNTYITTSNPPPVIPASTGSGRGRAISFTSDTRSDSDSEIYARILLTKRHGYPLWLPEPFANLPEQYQRNGVSIGDVGIITSEGAFDFLFNVCLPSDDPVNEGRVPLAFEPLLLNPNQDIAIAPEMHPPGCDITSASIRIERTDSNVHGVGAGLHFTSSSNEGAVLVLPDGASRCNLLPLKTFREYALRHASIWYDFVNNTLNREASNGSLYLVTGADKASSWGVAAFSNSAQETGLSLKFVVVDLADGAPATCRHSLERSGRAAVRTGPRRPDGQKNQCVFLRGYKLELRGNVLSAALRGPVKTSYILDSKSGDILAKGNRVPRSLGFGSWSGGHSFRTSRSGGPQEQCGSDSEDNDDVLVEHVPEHSERYHPSTIINQYLLNTNPDAQVAITHDDDWCSVVEDEEDRRIPEPSELIRRILTRYTVVLDAGCVYLEPGAKVGLQRDAPASEAASSQVSDAPSVYYGTSTDLVMDEAIIHQRQALEVTPSDHADLPLWLTNLGNSLLSRYKHTGDIDSLDEAITRQRQAVVLTPSDHADLPRWLNCLGISLQIRYGRSGDMYNLDEAIMHQRQAVELTPSDHADLPARLSNLGNSLQTRYERFGNIDNLDEAVTHQRQAVELTPRDHADLPRCLSNLGSSLRIRYERTGDMDNLYEAITHQRQAVELTPSDHPDPPARLSNLGNSLQTRYERSGDMDNLDETVTHQRQAFELTPSDHPDLPRWLNNLGNSLRIRYERTGDMDNLHEAITCLRQAVELTPSDHPNLPARLSNLGNSLQTRYERSGDMINLDEAVTHQRQAVELIPSDHADLPARLSNLGNSLQTRYERSGDMDNLDEAVTHQRQAVELTPSDHPDLPRWLNNLGNSLRIRYERTGDMDNLHEAVTRLRQAVELTPSDHPNLPVRLSNLGNSLQTRYERSGDIDNLDEAVTHQRQAVELTPSDHADLPRCLSNLGISLAARYRFFNLGEDLDGAISAFQKCIATPRGPFLTKFSAAVQWAILAHSVPAFMPASYIHAYSQAIDLLSKSAWIGQSPSSRLRLLSQVPPGVVGDAAACAIELSDFPLAIEFLEQGRTIFWTQFLQFRTELQDIRSVDPRLADELHDAGVMLERSTFDRSTLFGGRSEQQIQKQHRLAERWERLVDRVRQLPNLGNFLRRTPFSDLRKAANEDCPVVVINLSQYRCDALIIMHDKPIQLVQLPDLHLQNAQDQANAFRKATKSWNKHAIDEKEFEQQHLYPTLRYLWSTVVHPVLDKLGYMRTDLHSPPRVCWCPTGPLTFLPIHASGPYDKSGPDIVQRLVSSYTTTLGALARARSCRPPTDTKMVVVGIANTPYEPKLPQLSSTESEVDLIGRSALKHHVLIVPLKGEDAMVDNVIDHMKNSNFVHFACHGYQDQGASMDSTLYLGDGRLSLSQIASLRLKDAEFAFLSEDRSANGSGLLPNEAMHIAAGMQVAGYRSVVATMWSMPDWIGPEIVGKFYDGLFQIDSSAGSSRAPVALREAVLALRSRRDVKIPAAAWANFISIGV